jgi:hypothetical protein
MSVAKSETGFEYREAVNEEAGKVREYWGEKLKEYRKSDEVPDFNWIEETVRGSSSRRQFIKAMVGGGLGMVVTTELGMLYFMEQNRQADREYGAAVANVYSDLVLNFDKGPKTFYERIGVAAAEMLDAARDPNSLANYQKRLDQERLGAVKVEMQFNRNTTNAATVFMTINKNAVIIASGNVKYLSTDPMRTLTNYEQIIDQLTHMSVTMAYGNSSGVLPAKEMPQSLHDLFVKVGVNPGGLIDCVNVYRKIELDFDKDVQLRQGDCGDRDSVMTPVRIAKDVQTKAVVSFRNNKDMIMTEITGEDFFHYVPNDQDGWLGRGFQDKVVVTSWGESKDRLVRIISTEESPLQDMTAYTGWNGRTGIR